MLLNIVTDDQLLTSQIVKTILLVIICGGIAFNFIRLFRAAIFKRKIINFIILSGLVLIFIFVFKQFRIEASLLKNPLYVKGTTLGYCNVFGEGKGIQFEYEMQGRKFLNCNTFHPLSADSIVVPGGRYTVRVSIKFPDEGRMNFKQKAE